TLTNGFTVTNPAPMLTALDPAVGTRLATLEVELTGAGFLADASSVDFGLDITVNSVIVPDPARLTVNITIAPGAATGPRDVSVENATPGGGSSTLGDAFAVENPVPALTGITPTAGKRTATLTVTLTGAGFLADASSVDFGPDITVNSVTVASPTELTADITIAPEAELGTREVSVRNAAPGGGESGPMVFTVFESSPWHDDPGWHEVAPIPAQAGNRRDMPHRGAWLAVGPDQEGTPAIYAAKGNKLQNFYRYDPLADAWTELAPVPFDPMSGRPLRQGARGASDGVNSVYMVHGNNTSAFWRYDIAANEWSALPCVPDGPSGKRVRGGGDMLYITDRDSGWVYLLKGDRDEFWRYNTESRDWEQLATPPAGIRNRWKRDSWLAFDGEDAIFAHKANYYDRASSTHDFYRYRVSTNSWDTLRPAGMPLHGLHNGRVRPKRARDGGAGAFDENAIFALKGGNTQQFWRYDVTTDRWAESDTLPTFSPITPRRRRVNAGADLVHYRQGLYRGFFALKGNKTQEFWRYVLPIEVGAVPPARPERGGMMARPGGKLLPGLLVGPSPTRDELVLHAGNTTGPVRVELVSIMGAVLAERTVLPHARARIPVGHLPAGSYFIRVRDGETTVTRKVVIGPGL
ncbi:MAG TPA: T9SS type A sorting domain-containing protein, partial [candidate division WOR-3 bacterium]|nr:T9SS type A sorting domain-containing protein [candidate division WOR-3 bacterium]